MFRRADCAILPALNRYSRIGIAIDIPYLRELSAQFDHEAKALEKDIFSYVPSHALNQFVAFAARIDSEAEEADETIEFNAASADNPHARIRSPGRRT